MWTQRHTICKVHIQSRRRYALISFPQEGGVFAAKLTFVGDDRYLCHSRQFYPHQPSDYPLSPFKMKFEPPLFHPNSETSRS